MVLLQTLRTEVTFLVNNLAKAVVAEIFALAETISLNTQSAETWEKLGSLVDSWCVDAVDRILHIFTQAKTDVGHLQAPPPSDHTCEVLVAGGGLSDSCHGKDVRVWPPPTDDTYIVVYQNAAENSQCLLVSEAEETNKPEGGNHSCTSCPIPPSQADHDYARPLSPPPGAAASAEGRLGRDHHSRSKREAAGALLECPRCSMLFPTSERLAEHQRKSHPACSVCGVMFPGILKLREHQTKEHGLLPYACDFCPKMFGHKAHRDLHVKARHTGEKSCRCDLCGKAFASSSVLKVHRVTHFDKTFICDVCGRGFYHACHLTRHKLVHGEERPHRCSTCGRGFRQAANLRSHQATHAAEKQLCSVCGKRFRRLSNHLISKHLHELPVGELPPATAVVGCDICGKKFPNLSQCRVHQRSHSGEKPFHCDVCGKSYRLKELLRDHRYTHTEQTPYRCSLCSKTFNTAGGFLRHRSIHSGETPFSCHDCGKHFRLLAFLKAHLQTKAHLRQAQQRQDSAPADL